MTARVVEQRVELPNGKLDSQLWLELPDGTHALAAQGPVFAPQLAQVSDGHLIVFRLDGLKPPPTPPAAHSWTADDRYPAAREGGGASVGYAYRAAAGRWRRGYVARAEEILVRDRMEQDAFAGRLYPSFEYLGPPALRVDGAGVVWCFWNNPERRHTYAARWLGPDAGFSTPFEATRAGFRLPEVVHPPDPWPIHLSAASRERVLFVDLLALSELRGVELAQGQPVKLDGPILTPQQVAVWRGGEIKPLGAPRVWRDDGRLLMELGPRGPMGSAVYGRLESDDGLDWRWCDAAEQGVWIDGQRDTAAECRVTWFLDDGEPDRRRRYKGALIRGLWTQNPRRWLVTSPDGVHWKTEAEIVGMHHLAEHGGPSFRDPRTGDYVAVGRTSSSGHRALGMLRSQDLVHWEGGAPLLDVDDPTGSPPQLRRGHPVADRILDPAGEKHAEQIYWGTVWPESGAYLCLYGRYDWDARYAAHLAFSRDGLTFQRPFRAHPFLPTGAPGEWDSGIVFMDFGVTRPVPFPEHGLLRLYYAGSTWRHGADPYRTPAAVGVADLPQDGWTYLRPKRDAPLPATATTVPIQAAGAARLRLNAQGPVTAAPLSMDGTTLADLPETGLFRLQFTFHSDRTRLYSFQFDPP